MDRYVLRNGDAAFIAESLGCSTEQVRSVIRREGETSRTILQIKILRAIEKRSKQNQEFIEFCDQLKKIKWGMS
jgi:hypothetical protein